MAITESNGESRNIYVTAQIHDEKNLIEPKHNFSSCLIYPSGEIYYDSYADEDHKSSDICIQANIEYGTDEYSYTRVTMKDTPHIIIDNKEIEIPQKDKDISSLLKDIIEDPEYAKTDYEILTEKIKFYTQEKYISNTR